MEKKPLPKPGNCRPLYDVRKTYLENLEKGPFYDGPIPARRWAPKEEWIDFLGYRVASPIGVPAGPLLDAKWIALAAKLGFDIVSYKTIRSHLHDSHPLPNVVPVAVEEQLVPGWLPEHLLMAERFGSVAEDNLAITNSFGNPSRTPEFLQGDIPKGNAGVAAGQVMIVSVFGSQRPGIDIIDDFVAAAQMAKDFGAKIIEANYSCPNVSSKEGSLYASPDLVYNFSKRIVAALQDTPLIIKMGPITSEENMRKVLTAAARAGARGVCGINTISMKVLDHKGAPALGPGRSTAGICGSPIRHAALDFTQRARGIIDREKLNLALLTTGGATQPAHFRHFLEAGADIAMTATGMMWDPYLALRYHEIEQPAFTC